MEDGLIDESVLRKQEEALNLLDRDPFKGYKFPCSYCDKRFPTDFVLDYHLKLIHKGNCHITYQYLKIYCVNQQFCPSKNRQDTPGDPLQGVSGFFLAKSLINTVRATS